MFTLQSYFCFYQDEECFDNFEQKSRQELYEKLKNKHKRPSGEISQPKKGEEAQVQLKTYEKRKYAKIPTDPNGIRMKSKEGESKVEGKKFEGIVYPGMKNKVKFIIPKLSESKKKPALEAFLKHKKDEVQKVKEKENALFDNVKTVLLGLESEEASPLPFPEVEEWPGNHPKSKMESDEVTTISDNTNSGVSGGRDKEGEGEEIKEEISVVGGSTVARDKEGDMKGEEEEEVSVVGGSVRDRNQEEEEITVLSDTKSRSESPEVLAVTKDIPECGVKFTLTKSPPPASTRIKAPEDIQSDDEFGPSQ